MDKKSVSGFMLPLGVALFLALGCSDNGGNNNNIRRDSGAEAGVRDTAPAEVFKLDVRSNESGVKNDATQDLPAIVQQADAVSNIASADSGYDGVRSSTDARTPDSEFLPDSGSVIDGRSVTASPDSSVIIVALPEVGKDTFINPVMDTLLLGPDTQTVISIPDAGPDTLTVVVSPDTAPLVPDTAPVSPDTAPVIPDTAPVPPDTAPLIPDAGQVYKEQLALIDDCRTPLPTGTNNRYQNQSGGDRGLLNTGECSYVNTGNGYDVSVTSRSGGWTYCGLYFGPANLISDNRPLDFKAVYGPYIKSKGTALAFPAEVIGIDLAVNTFNSITNNPNLTLLVQLKGDGYAKTFSCGVGISALGPLSSCTWSFAEADRQKIREIAVLIDHAEVGDSFRLVRVALKTKVADPVAVEEQAFVRSLGWLLANYNSGTGMVQDRSSYADGTYENVPATAKTAKAVAYGYLLGYVTLSDAQSIVGKIATTLLVLPQGPSTVNKLWPRHTKLGGTANVDGGEWSSGDTVFASLDLIAALKLVNDPQGQIPAVEAYVKAINWTDLAAPDGGFWMGYDSTGARYPYEWHSFGMEQVGMLWAYAAATGNLGSILPPSSNPNGSGFIDNARYPDVMNGNDHWGNNWDAFRLSQAGKQINWYGSTEHQNTRLSAAGLFGLSAGEKPIFDPSGGNYVAFGTGGSGPANDGNHDVVVTHYAAMVSDLYPAESKHLWQVLNGEIRSGGAAFLLDRYLVTPLNAVESLSVDATTGAVAVNHLKGSWNLALQAEGWALANPAIRTALGAAVSGNAFLASGLALIR